MQQIKSTLHNHRISSGRTGRFQKGIPAWNFGTKGQHLTGKNRTSFLKGNIPANLKPVGAERICSKDGYVLIKVSERDPHTGFATRYKHKHIVLWESKNGPVPNGMTLFFADGNKLNIKLSNLICISRAVLARINQMHYHDQPDSIKPIILSLAQLKTIAGDRSRKKTSNIQSSFFSQEGRS
ncbi:MAG: HNH endonuclease signature motif containing protein [Candidatus Paceibacterota bacterium]